MSDDIDPLVRRARERGPSRRPSADGPAATPGDFLNDFSESLPSVLDIETWRAGRHTVTPVEVADTHAGLLFNGAVEACDGTSDVHDTLALTIHQIGVSLVSYRGERGCWQQRLFRKDLRLHNDDPVVAVMDLLERRHRRGGLHPTPRDVLSELAQRGLMSYAERAVLAGKATAPWRLGHGSPAPLELVGARFTDVVIESIKVIRRLIEHGRIVFVASEPSDRALLTIGQGLYPLEYAIVGTMAERITPYLDQWAPTHAPTVDASWDGEVLSPQEWVRRLRDELAPRVVYGLYRATMLAPPQLFYAHVDHAHVAARIAIADSVLLEQRGFPLLIDLADRVCKSVYAGGSLKDMAASAYAAAGAPFRYQSERPTRDL
ncbi:MAG TPA: hypothetical protein VFW33_02385 [Gemmataceae bacterium]|nr:hypothetical protein [Gemmataceae bacterium]